jgi:diguanylate cyclase (GGDEF)-like protein
MSGKPDPVLPAADAVGYSPGMRRMPRHRYLLGFAFAALILVLVGLAILLATQRFEAQSRMVVHSQEVIARLERIDAMLLDSLLAQRSYLLTAQTDYRDAFRAARPLLRRELAELQARVADNPSQSALVAEIAGLVEERMESAAEGIRVHDQAGHEAAREYTRGNRGLGVMRLVGERMSAFVEAERALLAERQQASRQSSLLLQGLGILGIPLSLGILGWILALLAREVRERAATQALADQANVELERTVDRVERASDELRQLRHYAGLLQSCRDVPEALDVTRRSLEALLPGVAGTLYMTRASQDYLEAEAGWGGHAAAAHALFAPHECWALRRARQHLVEDLAQGMACSHCDRPVAGGAATACLPLSAQGINLGLLYLSTPQRGALPGLEAATAAAEQLSLALANLRLRETLRQQSIRDPLTGLFNRRYLEESLPRELARCERRSLPLALMMIDLDHFKTFNDRHGHDGGDAVLAAFGRLLQAHSRAEDIPCRYGGEEFLLILPEADLAAARRRAEDIRSAVAALRVQHLRRELGGLTASIGLAVAPDHAGDGATLQRLADEALYRAKRAGRDRVEVAVAAAQD